MKKEVAVIELTGDEMAEAIAQHISRTRLNETHIWNGYQVTFRHTSDGEFSGGKVRYYINVPDTTPDSSEVPEN